MDLNPPRPASGRPGDEEPAAPSKSISVLIPLDWLPELKRRAEEEGLSRHAALRLAIWEWLQKPMPPAREP